MITTILVVIYCIIGFIFHVGIKKEASQDTSGDLDKLSPMFVNITIWGASMLWPLLIAGTIFKKIKGE
jgi:preprotein translocase subunit SecY